MFKLAALITQVVSHGYFICFPPKCEGCCKVGSEFAQAEAKRNGGAKKKKRRMLGEKKNSRSHTFGWRTYLLPPRGKTARSRAALERAKTTGCATIPARPLSARAYTALLRRVEVIEGDCFPLTFCRSSSFCLLLLFLVFFFFLSFLSICAA